MIWYLCFGVSLAILAATAAAAVNAARSYRSGRALTPFSILFVGVAAAVFVGLVPVIAAMVEGEPAGILKLALFDALQTFQIFTVNVGGDFILENIDRSATAISAAYSTYMSCMLFAAPLLTFGFVISLFRSALSDLRYRLRRRGDVYAFSELNERSLMLARSIREGHENAVLVFADAERDGGQSELTEQAKELHAILLYKDLLSAQLQKHSRSAALNLFAIRAQESENLLQALKLLEKYREREHTNLYVFSAGAEGELLLSDAPKGKVRLRRVNETRSLIYQFLYDEGERLFETAAASPDGSKSIRAVIVGLDNAGQEMLRALTWYCQMDGYTLELHAFDADPRAADRFAAQCPELLSGSDAYPITIHAGADLSAKSFADCFMALPASTFVFVSLGSDTENIRQAAYLRMLCERAGAKPILKTIVSDAAETEALSGVRNYRGQPYGIEAMGDAESLFSEKVLIGSELERLALERHCKWGQEEEFWQYEYNYRSSMASAIHRKARIACGIPGADKTEAELTEAERDGIERLEHRRWNAYMRAEGYVYSGSPDKSSRNDLAKMHHNLVPFDTLSAEDQRKDSRVGSR